MACGWNIEGTLMIHVLKISFLGNYAACIVNCLPIDTAHVPEALSRYQQNRQNLNLLHIMLVSSALSSYNLCISLSARDCSN
jgi:hypothetical protein